MSGPGEETVASAHDADAHRFGIEVDGHAAFLQYERVGEVLVVTHTVVPAAIGGRGIAARLVEAAVRHARSAGLRVRPACSYAAAWFGKHPEARDLLA